MKYFPIQKNARITIKMAQQRIHHFEEGLEQVLLAEDHLVLSSLLDLMDSRIYFHSSREEDLVEARVVAMEEIHLQAGDLKGARHAGDLGEVVKMNMKPQNLRLPRLSMLSRWLRYIFLILYSEPKLMYKQYIIKLSHSLSSQVRNPALSSRYQ